MMKSLGLFSARLIFSVLSEQNRGSQTQVFSGKQYTVNNGDWKCYYVFGVGLSAIGSNKNTAVYYP